MVDEKQFKIKVNVVTYLSMENRSLHKTFAEINDARDVSNLNVCLDNKPIFYVNIKEHSTHFHNTIIKKRP